MGSAGKRRPGPKPSVTGPVVKTSVKIRRPLWMKAHRFALTHDRDLASLINEALEAYLKGRR